MRPYEKSTRKRPSRRRSDPSTKLVRPSTKIRRPGNASNALELLQHLQSHASTDLNCHPTMGAQSRCRPLRPKSRRFRQTLRTRLKAWKVSYVHLHRNAAQQTIKRKVLIAVTVTGPLCLCKTNFKEKRNGKT